MWDSLQQILPIVVGKYSFTAALKAVQICQEYRNLAPNFLPAAALKNTFPKSFQKKTLTIGVFNSSWAEQVQVNKHKFIEALNHKFGPATVKTIRIQMAAPEP